MRPSNWVAPSDLRASQTAAPASTQGPVIAGWRVDDRDVLTPFAVNVGVVSTKPLGLDTTSNPLNPAETTEDGENCSLTSDAFARIRSASPPVAACPIRNSYGTFDVEDDPLLIIGV